MDYKAYNFLHQELWRDYRHLANEDNIDIAQLGVSAGLYDALRKDAAFKDLQYLFGSHILRESDDQEWKILSLQVNPLKSEPEIQDVIFD